jgi:hypothetical protein
MAFTDEILSHSDRSVTIVDRRHAPGGHWVDAYPFVRLHQPSAFYGVSSTKLGADGVDTIGLNAGFYELAGPQEICAYYDQVMHRRFLESGRVRYFPNSDYVGDYQFVRRPSGESISVKVGMKLFDSTFLEGTIPATSPPPYEVADGVRSIAVGELARVEVTPERYVIVGAGKTGMDAIVWLLGGGVAPDRITWIKPREGWWLNRKYQQPLTLLPDLYEAASLQFQAMAEATTVDSLFAQLEALGLLMRVDPNHEATMCRLAIVSEAEVELLRTVEDVVRLGHVTRILPDAIELQEGRIPATPQTLYVNCATDALPVKPPVPVFAPGKITSQPLRFGFAPLNAALTGFVEATVEGDQAKNALCPPLSNYNRPHQFLDAFRNSMTGEHLRSQHAGVSRWMKHTRLNPGAGIRQHIDDPRVGTAHERIQKYAGAAAQNLDRLLAEF